MSFSSSGDTQRYLDLLERERQAELNEARLRSRYRFVYRTLQFWAAVLWLVTVGFIGWSWFVHNPVAFDLAHWECWATFGSLALFTIIFFVSSEQAS